MDPRRALSFGVAADAYARARPTYPEDALRWVLPSGARRVLDVGAGTGKLTQAVRALGLEVVAVEPDDAMRAHIDGEALAGTAEQIPLPDASVDAVVAGQAFHWFDPERALPEMVRVLRPGGPVGLLWNVLDDGTNWVADLCDAFGAEDRLSLTGSGQLPPYDEPQAGLSPLEQALFPHEQQVDADLVVENLLSRSTVILLPDDERAELVARVRRIVPPGTFALPYVCGAWRAYAPVR